MVDFLRSAVSYLSGGSGGGERGSEFIGQVVDLGGGFKLKVRKVIAEGKRSQIGIEMKDRNVCNREVLSVTSVDPK